MIAYITINIDPILFHIGAFSLRWYSLIMVAATIVGTFIFAGQLRRKSIEPGHVTAMLAVVVPSAIVGARRATTEDRRHGHTALSRSLLVRPLLHLVLPGQQPHRARPEGGADRRPGRARGGGTGGVAAAPPGAATSSGSATRRPPAFRFTPALGCAMVIPFGSDGPSQRTPSGRHSSRADPRAS